MRFFLIILLIGFLFVYSTIAQEDDPVTTDDCELPICLDIETDWEQFNYDTGCENGYDCVPENFQLYQLVVALELASECEADDLFCRNLAFLQAVAVLIYDSPLGDRFNWQPPYSDAFAQVLYSVENGNFADALSVLLEPPLANYQNTLLIHSRGLVYELLNQPTEALREYDVALSLDNHQMATLYVRGLLYGRLGLTVEASFVGAWLEDYFTAFAPDLLYLVEPFVTQYPVEVESASDWVRYPVLSEGISPAGVTTTDLTQQGATLVQLSFYDELDVILAVDVSGLRYFGNTGDVVNTYVLRRTENDIYVHEFADFAEQLGSLDLQLRDGLYWGEETLIAGEGVIRFEFVLVPSNQSDPRSGFGEPACEGGVISRLRPGMPVYDMGLFYYMATPGGEFDPNLYFDDGNRGDMTDPDTYPWLIVRLTENRLCIGNELWWEVTDGLGNTGWRPENVGLEYTLNSPIRNNLFYCPNILTTRLYIESAGTVLPSLGNNNLRIEPGVNAENIGQIPEGGQFVVVGGPVCADNMAWWQVEYEELIGWTAEGQGETYWLEPILSW